MAEASALEQALSLLLARVQRLVWVWVPAQQAVDLREPQERNLHAPQVVGCWLAQCLSRRLCALPR